MCCVLSDYFNALKGILSNLRMILVMCFYFLLQRSCCNCIGHERASHLEGEVSHPIRTWYRSIIKSQARTIDLSLYVIGIFKQVDWLFKFSQLVYLVQDPNITRY